jgi:hypothetical protein
MSIWYCEVLTLVPGSIILWYMQPYHTIQNHNVTFWHSSLFMKVAWLCFRYHGDNLIFISHQQRTLNYQKFNCDITCLRIRSRLCKIVGLQELCKLQNIICLGLCVLNEMGFPSTWMTTQQMLCINGLKSNTCAATCYFYHVFRNCWVMYALIHAK